MAQQQTPNWPKIDDLKAGDRLVADGGFTCIRAGCLCTVKWDGDTAYRDKSRESGLYVECDDGRHYLAGQVDDDGGLVVGFTRAPVEVAA